jgi:signal transduction histidine kinase/PAS domain-containing protein/ActR/RegA family two-component response regulator
MQDLSNEAAMELDALNEIPSGVGIFDLKDSVIEMKFLNDGFYRMIGARREDRARFFSKGTINSVHPDDRPGLLKEAGDSIAEKRRFEYRFRNLNGAGEYMWIGIRARHKKLDENTERFFASYYNVDKYVSEASRLEAYSSNLDDILGNIPGGVSVFSQDGGEVRLEYANAGFYRLHHGSREYWGSKSPNPVDWLLPEDREIFWNQFREVSEGRQKMGDASYRVTGEDGCIHWVNNQFCFAYVRNGVSCFYASFTDLDELKKAEQAHNEARRMYEAAVEDTNLVVWEYDIPNRRIIMAENEFTQYDYRKFGLPKITENAPDSLVPYIDDSSTGVFLEMYRKVEAGEPSASCEVWYKLKPGREPRCEHISYTTVFDDAGKPVKAYGIGRNITRRKMEQAEYDRLRAQLTGNLTDVVGSFQLNLSKNRYISGYSPYPEIVKSLQRETADEHFAAAAATITDQRIRDYVLKEFRCAHLTELFRNGKQQLDVTYPLRSIKGGMIWIHSTLHLMQNPTTGDVEGITYSKDCTEQKRTNEIVGRISSTGCDYIGVLDVAGKVFGMHTVNWNCTALAAGEKAPYESLRKMLSEDYIPSDKREAFLDASRPDALEEGLKEKAQYVIAYDYLDPAADGLLLKKQIVFSWLDENRSEILCVQQDVTEAYRKEQEQILALEKAKNEADAANDAKSAFLSGMSHDLRTPLNGVLSFTSFALQENDPEKKQDYLRKIDTSGKLLRDLINDTLELSRIESGKFRLDTEAVMPQDLIPAVTTALKPTAELKHIRFETDSEMDPSVPIWCDRLKIQKIALNLISNAIKYTPEGGSVKVGVKSEAADGGFISYILTVEDTGIGMSREFMERMYEPFAQEKRSDSVREIGTGLGLSIVKRYVDLMGGSIEAESRVHQGTRIRVSIPVSTGKTGMAGRTQEPYSLKSLEGKHVLLCEDNYMNTEIAVMLLKDRGVIAETAENGRAGLEKFRASETGAFDAVLMDIRMPVMDGYEAARQIRRLPREDAASVPIIAMTADAFEESIQEAQEAGMNAYVTKPIDPQIFYQTLSKYLR